jgi:enterochelin esterase family protein
MMRTVAISMLLSASLRFAQGSSDFQPASSNVLDAQYPQVDGDSRVQIRFKAPDSAKLRVNSWGGEKALRYSP